MPFRRLLPVAIVIAGLLLPARAASADDIESQVMAMINAGRSAPLALHHGLLSEAESHSQYMSSTGNLNHDNADERANGAAPDPAEGNGAPDDGFAQAGWCENATYVTPAQGDPARAIFNNWKNSPPHAACMNNTGKNVGAVGIYWDGSTYWATFVAEADSTPPGGRSGGAPQTQDVTNPSNPTKVTPQVPGGVYAHPTPAPAHAAPVYNYAPSTEQTTVSMSPSPAPSAVPAKRVTAPSADLLIPDIADDSSSASASKGFGLPELAGIVAALVLGCLFLERRMYVPAEFVAPDVVTPRDDFALSTSD